MTDYNLYKILLLGDCSSGKTSLIYRLVHNNFLEYYVSTIGIDFNIKSFMINDKKVKLQIWDSCGQERFNALTRSYYRNTDAFIICYDILFDVDLITFSLSLSSVILIFLSIYHSISIYILTYILT